METVNGKLINQKMNKIDEIDQKTEYINQRCEYLESQLKSTSNQDYLQYIQKLEQRIGFLEDTTSKLRKSFFNLKIVGFISLFGIWFLLNLNNQSETDTNRLQEQSVTTQLIQLDI